MMKHIIYIVSISIFIFSCRKNDTSADYLLNIKNTLAGVPGIDFNNRVLYKQDSSWFLRIGFIDKNIAGDFILVKMDTLGHYRQARIIHLEKVNTVDKTTFNGNISVQNLDGSFIIHAAVANGHIQLNTGREPALNIVPGSHDYDLLPEVIVVAYMPSTDSPLSWSDYISYQSLMDIAADGTGANGTNNGTGGSSSSGNYSPVGSGSNSSGPPVKNNLVVNYEISISKPGIDLNAYMNCFTVIPDAGATCSVTIFTDLPVNDDPTAFFNWYTGATGHAFLQLTKSNGNQSVTQVIGFTAQKPLQALTANTPVASKIVDNAGHKFNAYLRMDITASQLNAQIDEIKLLSAAMKYSINAYNCVDFALQVFNSTRGVNPLIIPRYPIPGQTFSGSNTPEGLYELLTAMKESGGAEANNILTGAVLHAGNSHGPCN